VKPQALQLHTQRLGPLPLVNHYLERLGLLGLFERFVPTTDRRCRLSCAHALGVLLRSIITEREPLYRLGCPGSARTGFPSLRGL
jgi:hypothetical protein